MIGKREDLSGKKFNKLTVVEWMGINEHRSSVWKCTCDCGREVITTGTALKRNRPKSCGKCIHNPPNTYYQRDSYMVGTLTNGEEFLFDLCDSERIMSKKWYKNKNMAVVSGLQEKLHVFIMNTPEKYETDHVNGNVLDNRRSNLRICTHQQNLCNQKKRSQKTSSQYKGVSLNKRLNKYAAYVSCFGKRYQLGVFENEMDAALAYNSKADQLFGEYARLNIINLEVSHAYPICHDYS